MNTPRKFAYSRLVGTCIVVGGVSLFALACAGDSPTGVQPNTPAVQSDPRAPVQFGLTEAGNGSGQCLGQDAVDAGFLQNLAVDDLNCTSNDVDISFAEITLYSINDPAPAGGYTPLPAGEEIDCVPGDVIYAVTDAKIQNSAQARYDFGLWVNPVDGGDALLGAECLHFNLVNGENGATIQEVAPNGGTPDQCGDIGGTALVTVPLDTLVLTCPSGGATSLSIDACAAWSNSTTGSADRYCPVSADGNGDPVTTAEGFRLGTTPGTTAKCRCEPLDLPINVKGVIRVDKVTIPSGDAQSFAFTPTGTDFTTAFNLTDASAPHSSGPIDEGTYTITETVPAGWALTGRSCVLTGTATAATFSNITNGVSVDLGSGQDVTCTFTNTKLASVTIKKVTVPAEDPAVGSFTFSQNFDGTGNFSLGHNGTKLFSNVTPGVAKTVVESDPTPGYDLTAISCTGAATYTGTVATRTLSVTPAAGETIVCTFTNTARGSITIVKDAVPDDAEDFAFTTTGTGLSSFTLDDDADGTYSNQTTFSNLASGSYTVVEGAETNWDLTLIACTGGGANTTFSLATRTASIGLDPGESVTCTFTNKRKARLIVEKVVVGGGTQSFDFTRNPGSVSFSLLNGQSNNSGYTLAPGTYRVCEPDLAVSWSATAAIDGSPATLINPDDPADLGNRCVDVTLAYGDSKTVTWTNTPPPGGDARTIGYWRNWASCSNSKGHQYEKALDDGNYSKTLDGNLPQTIGDLLVDTCAEGVAILSKKSLDGYNMASDAAYGLAAQLLAAKLNISAGAGFCTAATTAIADAQALLELINFTGYGTYLKTASANRTLALSLAATLDSYNNNTLCP